MQTRNLSIDFGGVFYAGYNYESLPIGAALLVAVNQIDQAADVARASVINDPLRALEHQRAADEARAFQQAGYAGDTPAYVKAWADAAGLEPQEAADSILAKAKAWDDALLSLRALRLKGKQDVQKATTHAEAEAIADVAIAAIKESVQGLGLDV
ncbi:hypothetical protein [Pseudomonas sp. RW405]|uniref:hypothetical protein n=1 Tax=Pseudomonas sp. RW405 TaxID=2202652 RepID=UPI000D72F69A|nr:hypothetical protein [Pseudomonas sp. RW405]PWY44427.1 hypothetical protein DK184_06885 [Pseudomonas sp. RW405]